MEGTIFKLLIISNSILGVILTLGIFSVIGLIVHNHLVHLKKTNHSTQIKNLVRRIDSIERVVEENIPDEVDDSDDDDDWGDGGQRIDDFDFNKPPPMSKIPSRPGIN